MNIYLKQFFKVAVIYFFVMISPGPDFAVVIKQSISYGRKKGVFTSLGVGTGILIHVSYSLLGIGLLISKSVILFNIFKTLGALYLIYLGITSILSKSNVNLSEVDKDSYEKIISRKTAFLRGLMTNVLNPKVTLFFLSLFTAVIRPDTPIFYQVIYGLYISLACTTWFSLLAFLFGNLTVRKRFKEFIPWVEGMMGIILIVLGVKLAFAQL